MNKAAAVFAILGITAIAHAIYTERNFADVI